MADSVTADLAILIELPNFFRCELSVVRQAFLESVGGQQIAEDSHRCPTIVDKGDYGRGGSGAPLSIFAMRSRGVIEL